MARYVTPKEAAKYFGVCLHTLRRWEKQGWIHAVRTPSGRARRYDLDSYVKLPRKQKRVVLYARVSSRAQKPDLERQIAKLVSLYPGAEVVGEIGGGLNFQRPRFLALLERVGAGDVGTIVVAHKDRLCRFGFDLVAWYCRQHGCEIVVLDDQDLSPQQELVEDILAILHCFSSRLHGLRKYRTAIQEDQDLSGASSG
ncbi:MAG TPA: IS607 family transposase [Synechococcus sp. M44_DOE_062]|nr:IS607 family transposase [Synechococcus sp. M44_DOE_062]